jgi:hypothetical protein
MNKKRYLLVVGIVAAAALLSTLLYTVLASHGPVISSLVAEPETVPPRGSCQIVCNATAPGGAELSYSWSISGGQVTGEGPAITWTAPDSAGSYDVSVTVTDSHGTEAKGYRTITVDSPPTITGLMTSANWTSPSGIIQVTCDASDSDRDELSYEWTADGGRISGTGAAVNWTAPDDVGAYNITVVIRDGNGGQETGLVSIIVNLGTPPAIERLIVTPKGPYPYLRKSATPGCNFDVYESKAYTIECVASDDSGELAYSWSPADEISGDGSTVTWTVPVATSPFKVTLTVIVSDVFGNSTSESILFWVSSCSCGTWGLTSGEISF